MLENDQTEYLIQDLVAKSGVNSRTIRFYQQEKLLPEPVYHGKFAYYNDDHLVRLRLILELKKKYLPLNEIASQLNSMTYQQVKAALESQVPEVIKRFKISEPPGSQQGEYDGKAAQEYITRLLQTKPGSPPREVGRQPAPLTPVSPRYVAGTPAESWKRITLSPGIELHFSESLSPSDRKRLDELIKFAKTNLFF